MRLAKRLGLPSLIAILAVFAVMALGGARHSVTPVQAQAASGIFCTPTNGTGWPIGSTGSCFESIGVGGSSVTLTLPPPYNTSYAFTGGSAQLITAGTNCPSVNVTVTAAAITYTCSGGVTGTGYFQQITFTFSVLASAGTGVVLQTVASCTANTIAPAGAAGSCGAAVACGTPATNCVVVTDPAIGVCNSPPGTGNTVAVGATCTANSGFAPTDENKWCTNSATEGVLSQTIGGNTETFSVTGPSKSFTLALFGPASTCNLVLYRGGTACNLTTNPCTDGFVQLTINQGAGATLGCGSGSLASQPFPAAAAISGANFGTCVVSDQGTVINIPCGNPLSGNQQIVDATCTGVQFDIQSGFGACLNAPTTACGGLFGNGTNFGSLSATVTVQWFATPGNGGPTGGIQLGTNTFTWATPQTGLLLVSASPQAIPSNGTVASVVSATFACGSGYTLLGNSFPLSNAGVTVPATFTTGSTTLVGQPIIGTGQNAICGAGLAGTFNFTSPGPVLFDNGRSFETVNCGIGGNVSPFGVGAAPFGVPTGFAGSGFNSTFPLIFTCTGAAVLAIGAGVAGDAPINVVYTGPLGLTAVGSTLITVVPSGIPRIAVSCNPSTIAAGSTGSICTATVTDINGSPLSGLTGATVTWTDSDPANASILPCLVSIPGSLNITTYPNIAPQFSPTTPCSTPTGQIPGQNTTFLNGQAAALLVASPTAHPETVTVTAALGVLIPPSFACMVAPYLPAGFGTLNGGLTATSGVGLPAATGCGFGNPVGFTGLATGLSATANGLGIGGVILPNTTSASTTVNIGGPAGILIAGATPTQPYALLRGCNQVIATTTAGTPIANIAALVSPASAVVSIWRFSNNTKQFQAGFFSDPNAPTDFNITGGINAAPSNTTTGTQAGPGVAGNQVTETYFICVNQAATIVSG